MVTCPGVTSGPPGFGLASDLDLRELLGIGGMNTAVRSEVVMAMTVKVTIL
jgi:hypothetical protein